MNWLAILESIMKIVANCKKESTAEATFDFLRKGGIRVASRLRKVGMEVGLAGDDLKAFVNDEMDSIKAATDDELKDFITMSSQFDPVEGEIEN